MVLTSILLATLAVSLISLIGAIFLLLNTDLKKTTFYFVSLASGTLLGTAFLHLIPESVEQAGQLQPLPICIGVFLFFILEKLFLWRHCHDHQHVGQHSRITAAQMVVVGDSIHNFIDGLIIASAFMADHSLGISVTAAIILHEIPQELGDFGALLHGGYSSRQALWVNFGASVAALAGALIGYFFLGMIPILQSLLLPLIAGGFLYIALADLIPQLHEHTKTKQTLAQVFLLAAGFSMVFLLKSHTH